MTRLEVALGVLLLFGQAVWAQTVAEQDVPRSLEEGHRPLQIALLELEVTGGLDTTLARPISDRLRQELFRTGRFTVVERNVMEQVFEEQSLHLAGCMSDQCVVEAGRILGVEQMVAGSISSIGSVITVNARLIDVETTRLTAAESVDCSCDLETVLTESLEKLANQLADAVDPREEEGNYRNGRIVHEPKINWEWTESLHGWGSMTAGWLERTGFSALGFQFGWTLAPFQNPSLFGSVGNGLYVEFPAIRQWGYLRPALSLGGGGMKGNKDFYDHSYIEAGITLRFFNFVLQPRKTSGLYAGLQLSMLSTYVEVAPSPDNPPLVPDPSRSLSEGGGDARFGVFVGSRFDLDWDIGGRSLFTFLELRAETGTQYGPEPNPMITLATGLGWKLRRQ